MFDRSLERAAFPRRIAGTPILGRTTVALEGVIGIADPIRYSEGSAPATVAVVMFPGDPYPPAMEAEVFQVHPRAPARSRVGVRPGVPEPAFQTVSNRSRAELAGLAEVPEARLGIFEGMA